MNMQSTTQNGARTMTTYTYFAHGRHVATTRSDTSRVAAEEIVARLPEGNYTNARELLSLPVGASIDVTDEPLRSIRRES